MVRRILAVLSLLFVAVALFGQTTYAGGWATITFDTLAVDTHAGEPTTVRFLVRQHGNNPVHRAFDEEIISTVHIRSSDGKTEQMFPATKDKEVGYYNAEVTFPTEGEYDVWVTLSVLQVDEANKLTVTVLPAETASVEVTAPEEQVTTLVAASSSASPAAPDMLPLIAVIGMGVLAVAGISVWALRRR